jgi:pyridoxamine 5'-phosphate oxidase
MDLYELRNEYMLKTLDETGVNPSPIEQFKAWFEEAQLAKVYEPNAMSIATSTKDGIPSTRMLLLKSVNEKGFTFFTNYLSKKGKHLNENPNACLLFFWGELERQVRIEGVVEKLTAEESDKYFQTRPIGSRLGAWVSPQSEVISGRDVLDKKHHEFRVLHKHDEIPRPQHWGGYILIPYIIEFWQGRENRLHDRIEYYFDNDSWKTRRLAP